MIKIRKIEDSDKGSDKLQWKRGSSEADFLVCENPKISRVVAIMVSELGEEHHDEIMFIEPSLNAIVVPVYKRKQIYLHEEYRYKVMREGVVIKQHEFDHVEIESLGRWSLEIPRGGFDSEQDRDPIDAAIREVEEESGLELKRKDIEEVGAINPNTAYTVSTIPVFMAKCGSQDISKELSPKEKEKIRNRKWYTIDEVKNMINENEIFCAVTLAALNLVLMKLEKNSS